MKKRLIRIVIYILLIFLMPISLIGRVLYHLSLLIKTLGYIMMGMRNSAKNEFIHFWSVWGTDF